VSTPRCAGRTSAHPHTMGWKHGLHAKPKQAKGFYAAIVIITAVAVLMNFAGINPMKALVFAGFVQGFSTPPLMLLIVLMTSNRRIMGTKPNRMGWQLAGWATTAAISAASIALLWSWIGH